MPRVTYNFISEDKIETACIKFLQQRYSYQHIDCTTTDPEDLNDGSNRTDKRDVVFKERLVAKCMQLNPDVPEATILSAVKDIMSRRVSMSTLKANKQIYSYIRDGINVTYEDANGVKRENIPLRLIDFDIPVNNEFLLVTQLTIKTTGLEPIRKYRRPDILLYINGLPIVFFELKNSNVKLQNALTDNLTNYKNDIPQLFLYNAFCILSNASDTKIGSFTADWENFYPWLRVDDEKEKVDKQEIETHGNSIEYLLAGLFRPERLLDYIENFILYQNEKVKIVAQNHQFLGVKHAFENFLIRDQLQGRLGVFWHTQGSGKSFAMVFFIRKVFRKCAGNFSFVVITDRDDLDKQISKNFLATEAVKETEIAKPKNSYQMREMLGQNLKIVFTLIQKFRYEKGEKYPLLYDKDEREVIVIVDEAHRTQYDTLADNMRSGLKGAHFLAFTGTPILKQKKTKQWFGEYVSEYTFQQAIEDHATLPLFYEKRVPEVLLQNEALNEELAEILEDEDLSDAQREKLENNFSKELEVIKRDDRLDTIAADIVYHFPRRGYRGKGMVISVDQFTTVRMYDKVTELWKKEQRKLQGRINQTKNDLEKVRLKNRLKYMQNVEMAVVISSPASEKERFEKQGLEIQKHINRLTQQQPNGRDIEDDFKDAEHPLQLVFVCAMWLTGFDAPTVSTLYIDKPMKGHTLMQTIARANRVTSFKTRNDSGQLVEKTNGEIIDYYNVFRNLKSALKDYGQGTDSGDGTDPVQDKSVLINLLDEAIAETLTFCLSHEVDLTKIIEAQEVFKQNALFADYADIMLSQDLIRKTFNVHFNVVAGLYEAAKPTILSQPRHIVSVMQFLHTFIANKIDQDDLDEQAAQVSSLLDRSVVVDGNNTSSVAEPVSEYQITKSASWNLANVDFEQLRAEFKQTEHKHIAIADMKKFIEKKIKQMLKTNQGRVNFAERYRNIIDRYNAGATQTEEFFEELQKFAQDLKEEDQRHVREGLTEDELEIFDLLAKDKLTKKEEQAVKLAAKDLIKSLIDASPKVLVQDWWRDSHTKAKVRSFIEEVLDEDLPDSYDKEIFENKVTQVFDLLQHLAINDEKWAS